MPIQQSVQTLIRADDFHDKALSFTVESVIEALPASHRDLVVTVSDGYYMTTSLNSQPRREQTFEHIQQPDRQWVASGIVNLAYAGDYPESGVLTIRNPVAESVVLPIEATSAVARNPELTINHSALSFTQTANDKPVYHLLTITQSLVDTPITFTTDAPAYFQLASDSRPYFGSTLTVVSPVRKFHVHIRYAATKRGLHKGQLTIQTPYDYKTVELQGRWRGWFPVNPRFSTSTSQLELQSAKPARWSGGWVIVAVLAVMSGLGYVGYTHKCQLFPALCRNIAPKTTLVKDALPIPDKSTAPGRLPKSETKAIYYPEQDQGNLTHIIDSLSRLNQSFTANKPDTERVTAVLEKPAVASGANGRRRETDKKTANQPQERTRPKPTSATEESELEKVLNKPF